jgi:SHAQKYF class myb-like DNA-binding protein
MFKTERIVLFKAKRGKKKTAQFDSDKHQNNLLNKKIHRFNIYYFDKYLTNEIDHSISGRWTLKEHLQFLEGLDKYGIKWKKINPLIKTRTVAQIRSHAQKFFLRLKRVKDEQLGIDFTLNNIDNIKEMINHIKSVNSDYDIVKVLLYLSEKYYANKKEQKNINNKKELNSNIQKKSSFYENNMNIDNNLTNDINNNLILTNDNPEINDYQTIIYNNFNNNIKNSILMANFNFINNIFISNYINNINLMNNNFNFINNNDFVNNNLMVQRGLINNFYPINIQFINNNIDKDNLDEKNL